MCTLLKRLHLAFLLALVGTTTSLSQTCADQQLSVVYKGVSFNSYTRSITTTTNELVSIGDIYKDHGFMAKFSPKGTPLFSYQYNPVYPGNTTYLLQLRFTDLLETRDGNFLLTGTVLQERYVLQVKYSNDLGVLLKTDKYGNILWSKKFFSVNGFANSGYNLAVTNVLETPGGDIIVYLAADYGKNYIAWGKVVCLNSSGAVKWTTFIATNDYDGKLLTRRGFIQTKDGSIVVSDLVSMLDRLQPDRPALATYLHLYALDPASGKMKWEKGYAVPTPLPSAIPDKLYATELADGQLVVSTTLRVPTAGTGISTKKAVRVTTTNKGEWKEAWAYHTNNGEHTELADVSENRQNSNLSYLCKDEQTTILGNIDPDGGIAEVRGYNTSGGRYPASCFSGLNKGYAIFNANFDTWVTRLLLTDSAGAIECANAPAKLVREAAALKPATLITNTTAIDQHRFIVENFDIQTLKYDLTATTECQQMINCCTDIIDSTDVAELNICEGSTYTLADNNVIKDSGTYYTRFKTTGGCDSIKFYHLKVHKDPQKLSLGKDVCFEGDSLLLKATEGYAMYHWSNGNLSTQPVYSVNRAGIYWVEVKNTCGVKRDSITVYKECDFPVYMPNAFTPNGDNLNDEFRIAPLNKNTLVWLRIYNRWGQLLFYTSDPGKGWDGTYQKQPAPPGVYVYQVEMKGLSGNRITQKGSFALIR